MQNFKTIRLIGTPTPAQVEQFVGMMQRMYDFHATLHPDWQTRPGWSDGSAGWVKRAADGDDYLFAMVYPTDAAGDPQTDTPAGYVIASFHYEAPLFVQNRFGYIADLWIEEAQRGQGAARSLLDTAYEWFREQGVNRVQLEVDVNNAGGRRFWAGSGYEDFEIVMRKDIRWRTTNDWPA